MAISVSVSSATASEVRTMTALWWLVGTFAALGLIYFFVTPEDY
jgi:hypothetical protein